jgi:hypothetical protein
MRPAKMRRYLEKEGSRQMDRSKVNWYCKNVLASHGVRIPLR